MGKCRYCGQSAGLLRRVHRACEDQHQSGRAEIISVVQSAVRQGSVVATLPARTRQIAAISFIDEPSLRSLIIAGYEKAVESVLDDHLLSEEEEHNLVCLEEAFALEQHEIDKNKAYTRVVQAHVLRELSLGVLPGKFNVSGNLPFNMQRGEKLVWLFQNVAYYEQKTRRHIEGRSSGVSLRIARGVYYRTGGFRGNPVETTVNDHKATGVLAFTTRNVYFASAAKSFRLPYNKIVAFTPFSDGLGLQRDALSAKPQTFILGDGWFVYNLAVTLSQMAAQE